VKVLFVYPSFGRHADWHAELREMVPANEYLGPPSLGLACIAAATPEGVDVELCDDRVTPLDLQHLPDADVYALGVFTPQATRAFEIAAAVRARGRKVVMGGIFPSLMPHVAQAHADAIVVGEGEAVWPALLADAAAGTLRPRYDGMPLPPDRLIEPDIDLYLDAEVEGRSPDDYPVQLSRGCPLHCDACALPGSMGKSLRNVPMPIVLDTVRRLARRGKLLSLTEDTSFFGFSGARTHFRAFLRELRGIEGARVSYIGISMPIVHKLDPTLVAECRDAGIRMFYLVCGFDEITRKAFGPGDPVAMQRAEACIRRCHDEGIEPYASFLIGNDEDDEGTVDRILGLCERTRLKKAEFVVSTPYPGTPLWHRLEAEGRIVDRTWARYNDANVVFQPKKMTPDELTAAYLRLWREFYRSRLDLAAAPREERTVQF
jgi:radical SAM superfamily enzyme YgiQ (UPF0313 family)